MEMIETILKKLSNFFGFLAVLCLVFLMLGTTFDVISRNFLGGSITGVFEMSEIAMALVVCLGLGWTYIDDGHIRVTLLVDKLSIRKKAGINAMVFLVVALFLIALAYPSTQEAIRSVAIKEFRWGVIEIPIWWVKVILCISLWFTSVQFIFGFIKNLKECLFSACLNKGE